MWGLFVGVLKKRTALFEAYMGVSKDQGVLNMDPKIVGRFL